MSVSAADRLRERAGDFKLDNALRAIACPLRLHDALASAHNVHSALEGWTQARLASGDCLRTAQAERIARGESVAQTARATGVSQRYVLATLLRRPDEDDDDE